MTLRTCRPEGEVDVEGITVVLRDGQAVRDDPSVHEELAQRLLASARGGVLPDDNHVRGWLREAGRRAGCTFRYDPPYDDEAQLIEHCGSVTRTRILRAP